MAFTVRYVDPRPVDVSEITPGMKGEMVSVEGRARDFSRSGETAFFQLDDGSGSIDVVEFRSERENLSGRVKVEGKVDTYRGELEIIAERISVQPK